MNKNSLRIPTKHSKIGVFTGRALFTAAALALIWTFLPDACIERGLISTNTGSRREFTDWILVIRTNESYFVSPIETYLKEKGVAFQHRWVPYRGTSKNAFGQPVMFAHGSPGAVLQIDSAMWDYIGGLPDEKKQMVYSTLSQGTQQEIQKMVLEMHHALIGNFETPDHAEQSGEGRR